MKNFGSVLSYCQLSFIIYDHSSMISFSWHSRHFQRTLEKYLSWVRDAVPNEGSILKSRD